MPESGVKSLCHSDILSIEEIVEIVKVASKNGIKKISETHAIIFFTFFLENSFNLFMTTSLIVYAHSYYKHID